MPDCLGQLQACRIRVARLDTDGSLLPGANNMIVSKSLVSVGFAPVYTDGDEIEEKNGCGEAEVQYKSPDTFKRGDLTIVLNTPDPRLMEMLSGGDLLTASGGRVGFAAPALGISDTESGVSLELWTKRINNGGLDSTHAYAHWVYPRVVNLRLTDHSHEAAALKPSFTGQALQSSKFFNGPGDDWPATSDRVYQWLPTNTLPTPQCGYIELEAS